MGTLTTHCGKDSNSMKLIKVIPNSIPIKNATTKGYLEAYIDYDRLINNGYTKDDALFELDYLCPYFPQFEDKKRQKYVVIKTSYGKGYQQGLNDIDNGTYEKEKLITRYEN